jgi:hypothetical protein
MLSCWGIFAIKSGPSVIFCFLLSRIRFQLGEIVFKPLPEMRENFAICLENLNCPWSSCHLLHDLPQLLPRIVDLLHSFWLIWCLDCQPHSKGLLTKKGYSAPSVEEMFKGLPGYAP